MGRLRAAPSAGPVIKDKLHFFLSYEKNKTDATSVRSGFVPTAAERAGDFSEPGLAGLHAAGPDRPAHGPAVPGQRDPVRTGSTPAGLAFLQLYQLPNNTPSSGCNNYVSAVPTPINWSQINARVDWSISNSTRLMVRYTQDSWTADNTILWGDSNTSTVGSDWDQPGKSFVAQLNQNIGSSMTNTLTFSYSANEITATRTGAADKVDAVNALLPTIYPSSIKEQGGNAQPWWWGSRRLRRSVEPVALDQQPGPVRHQGRLLGGVRKALREGRRLLRAATPRTRKSTTRPPGKRCSSTARPAT